MASARKTFSLPRVETDPQARLATWVQMVTTHERMIRRVERLMNEHGLTLPQFDVLANLYLRDGMTQQELAARLQVTKGNVCGLLDRLETAGWVERRSDAHDRRANRLSLTDAGRARVQAVRPAHDALVLDMLRPVGSSQLLQWRQLFEQLEAAADA